jgi:thymidylate kinase
LIGVVGPCSAGKSTLIHALIERGYRARHIAQDHSYVPDMWKRMVNPDVLIYLDVTYEISMTRRPLDMGKQEFSEQVERLSHAREHADFYLETDDLSPVQVIVRVLAYLRESKLSTGPGKF